MKLDKSSSERINLLRFPLIVGVVFNHAYDTNVVLSTGSMETVQLSWFSVFCRDIISQGLAMIIVPSFFLMSGYLFFKGFTWSINNYKRKILSRVHTLLIPFVFWNLITLLLLAIAQSLPATRVYFSWKKALISTFGVYDYFNALFGIDRSPISYQFWFIRDLMVMVLLVPIIQFILKTIPIIFLSIVSILWFVDLWPLYIPSVEAVLFFFAGSYLAVTGRNIFGLDKYGVAFLCFYAVILTTDTLTRGIQFNEYIHRTGVLLGIVSALSATKFALGNEKTRSFLLWASSCSFFVFAVHEPLLTIIRKAAYKLLTPNTDILILGLYFSIPIFVIAISCFSYIGLKYLSPQLLRILSGGR